MTRIAATFDGHVLHPEDSRDLQPNKRYLLTVEEVPPPRDESGQPSHPLTLLLAQAADLGIADLAERHDDYAHRR